MNRKERMLKTIRFEAVDRPPHSELIFDLAPEAFGLHYPSEQEMLAASPAELERMLHTCCEIYARTVEEFGWDFVLEWKPAARNDIQYRFIPMLKQYLPSDVMVGSYVWDSVICIDTIKDYMQFSIDLAEDPDKLLTGAERRKEAALVHIEKLTDAGCDMICVASDMAFNAGPFLSPRHFRRFTAPYLAELIDRINSNGLVSMLHSDGNLMPIFDQLLEMHPHILQSIDPMAGMDIAEVRKQTYGKLTLMGNVQCSFLQDGPAEKIIASAENALSSAADGYDGGYIFSTSNSVFDGLPLENYRVMLDYFRKRYKI